MSLPPKILQLHFSFFPLKYYNYILVFSRKIAFITFKSILYNNLSMAGTSFRLIKPLKIKAVFINISVTIIFCNASMNRVAINIFTF